MPAQDCVICALVSGATGTLVYADDDWVAGVLEGLDAPGWLVLALRRHAERAVGMNEAEATSLGVRLAELTRVLEEAADAERVYVYAFGEEAPHWHLVLTSRTAQVPPQARRAALFEHRERLRDPVAAGAIADRCRELLGAVRT